MARRHIDGMTRTQVQLPDALYKRVKRFAEERELSLAELTRRGLELLLDRFPSEGGPRTEWKLPRVKAGGIRIPLDRLHEAANRDEEARGTRHR